MALAFRIPVIGIRRPQFRVVIIRSGEGKRALGKNALPGARINSEFRPPSLGIPLPLTLGIPPLSLATRVTEVKGAGSSAISESGSGVSRPE